MTAIDLIKFLNTKFPNHEFKFVEVSNPEDFSKQYVISIDGIMKKMFQVSWEESTQQIIIDLDEMEKKVRIYLDEITTDDKK